MTKTINISPVPKNSGDKKSQQNSPVSANQVRVIKEIPESLTLFVPENLDIDTLLRENPPTFEYHRDKFLYIIHLITDIPSKNKDEDYIYVPLHSTILKSKVHNYREHLNYLVKHGIIEEDRQYIVGKKARGFRFTQLFNTQVKEVTISYPTLIKSFNKFIKTKQKKYMFNKIEEVEFLTRWFNPKLTIDSKSAINWLKSKLKDDEIDYAVNKYKISKRKKLKEKVHPTRKYNYRYIPVSKLQRADFTSTIDNTTGRFHSVLTQLKSELRQFVTYDDKKLVSIDIVNSQPYLFTIFLNYIKFIENDLLSIVQLYNKSYKIGSDIIKKLPYYVSKISTGDIPVNVTNYISSVTSGKFYEEFGQLLKSEGLLNVSDKELRKEAKNIAFSSLFSSNNSISYNEAMKSFQKVYPDVYNIMTLIKYGIGNHPTLACTLQNFEAQLILHQACKIISEINPEIPIFTIHDSIVTTEEHMDLVKLIMIEVLTKATGIIPTLKIEIWSS